MRKKQQLIKELVHIKLLPSPRLSISKDIDRNWLQLTSPKIIYLEKHRSNSEVNKIMPLGEAHAEEMGDVILTRGEKKNKNHNKLIDPLESKKNKIKTKKKLRTKIHINDEDDTLDTSESISSKEDKSLALSLMRPTSPLKKYLVSKKTISWKNNTKNLIKNKVDKNQGLIQAHVDKPYKIILNDSLSIEDLASLITIPATEIIKSLFLRGISATINQTLDIRMAKSIAEDYGVIVENIIDTSLLIHPRTSDIINEDKDLLQHRSPIVTVFGHVDHGKTTLLDAIRKTQQLTVEAGGITQAIVAYNVQVNNSYDNNKIIFLDTPGHEAFSSMRMLSIQVTDIGILVVSADDSLQTQSIEAIKDLQKYRIPFIVAINKIDKPTANVQKVKEDLAELKIISEEFGDIIPILEVSGLENIHIDKLLSAVVQMANNQSLKANPFSPASGTILDAHLDKKQGPVANVLVQNGTLKIGDYITNDDFICKIRTITSPVLEILSQAGPSSVVEISGLSSIPKLGSSFNVIDSNKNIKKQVAELQKLKDKRIKKYHKLNTRISVNFSNKRKNKSTQKNVNIVLKTDSEGTISAILSAFENIPQEKVQLNIVSLGVGEITPSDISLAVVSQSILLSFNNQSSSTIKMLASQSNITIADFKIIYNLIEYVEEFMLQFVDIDYSENNIGSATVETIFTVSKGNVAGCIVKSGKLKLHSRIRVIRKNEVVHSGQISSLKRVKEDVNEANIGNECGVLCDNFDAWQKKDEIQSYDLIELQKSLELK
jgi:translation initiation factor IF-2